MQAQVDSSKTMTFPSASIIAPVAARQERALDMVLSGGAGYYSLGSSTSFQPTGNIDFFAQTSILNFTAGFHWGFSNPSVKSLSVGLRFPITDSKMTNGGLYADAALLFGDNGADSNAFSSGLRFALAGRVAPVHIEYRLAAELRRVPFGDERFEAWGGVELGFFVNLLREEVKAMTRKDTIRSAMRFIMTSEEARTFDEAVTDADLDVWLANFWSKRETIANASPTAAHDEYMRRVAIADSEFGGPRRMGVESDRGRALLLFGEPDRIETGASSIDPTRRYTLWIYEDRVRGYKTAMFLFRTEIGNNTDGIFATSGNYRQVFSNIIGEESEGIPSDLPTAMGNYIVSFGR